MDEKRWTEVDAYLSDALLGSDPVLERALTASADGGLPDIHVTATQGRLLQQLALLAHSRRVLEVGTLGGYSTIWLGRALPADGRLVSLEIVPEHAEVARANIARAGLAEVAEVRLGPALDSLPQLEAEGIGPFDLAFIDADKVNNVEYFRWALRLGRPGTVIVVDNVVRGGAVADAANEQADVKGARAVLEAMGAEPRVSATAIQTVGSKGYDGFAIALVTG